MDQVKHILEVDSVILEFGLKRVLQDVYLKSETGRVTGILGRNGCGKSCLLKIIFGALKPQNGLTRIDQKALLKPLRKSTDMMFMPQFHFVPGFLKLKHIFTDSGLDFETFTERFPDFKPFYNTRIAHLSGGQRRVVEIYLVLANDSKFCLLDEPFSHIMPRHVEQIKTMINELKAIKGILLTDHMYKHIIDICDEIYVIKDGKTYLTKQLEDIERLGYTKMP